MADFRDLYTKPLDPNQTLDVLAPLAQTNEAILPQPSLENKSPLAMPNFANAQRDTGVDFVNELFKNTPAYDPRVAPMAPDQMDMEAMNIESQVPADKATALKQKLQKFQEMRKPASTTTPQVPSKEEPAKPDDLYLQQGVSKMLQGLARMGGGQIEDNADFYNQYRKYQLEKPQQELETKIKTRNVERMQKLDDPNSQESINMRKALEKLAPDLKGIYGADWDKIAANDKDSIFDIIRTREQIEGRKEAARLAAQQREENRAERKDREAERQAVKKEEAINKDVQKFQDKTQDTRNILNSVNDFETVLGFNLNDLDTKGSTIKSDGKSIDLPGVSAPGIGRVSFYSGDARKLRDAAANIFNVELKNRSGAAVTDQELKRLRDEFSSGKFNTEAELIDAIKRYKNRTLQVLKQQEAGYKPEVIKTYKDRYDVNDLMTAPERKELTTPKSQPKINNEDAEAINWAKQNSSDPRAQQILKMHGM